MNVEMPLKKIPVLKLILVIRNKSVKELADFVGNERSQVSTWVNGRDEPSREQAERIAEFLNWDIGEIWEDPKPGEKQKRKSPVKKVGKQKRVAEDALKLSESMPAPIGRSLYALPKPSAAGDWVRVPLYRSVAASRSGAGAELREDGTTWVPKSLAHCRPIVVSGESMKRTGIDDGDIVLVDEAARPKPGDIVVAEINGDTLLKRLVVRGKTKLLASESDEHGDVKIGDQGVRVLGVARMAYTPKKIK